MLARAACDARRGLSRRSRSTTTVGSGAHRGWLHDCGKVTTPEYVVDKATKLETIYDRIHEVRMRFEVLKRDAEIAYWQRIAAGGENRAALRATRDRRMATLDEEFAFVAALQHRRRVRWRRSDSRAAARRSPRAPGGARSTTGSACRGRRRQRHGSAPACAAAGRANRCSPTSPSTSSSARPSERMPPDNPWGFRMDVPRNCSTTAASSTTSRSAAAR